MRSVPSAFGCREATHEKGPGPFSRGVRRAGKGATAMADTVNTGGGAGVTGDVQAGTFIGRDQIIVISSYTGEQLELVLAQLREMLAGGKADLCADIGRQRLTVTAPDAPCIVLSEQA